MAKNDAKGVTGVKKGFKVINESVCSRLIKNKLMALTIEIDTSWALLETMEVFREGRLVLETTDKPINKEGACDQIRVFHSHPEESISCYDFLFGE